MRSTLPIIKFFCITNFSEVISWVFTKYSLPIEARKITAEISYLRNLLQNDDGLTFFFVGTWTNKRQSFPPFQKCQLITHIHLRVGKYFGMFKNFFNYHWSKNLFLMLHLFVIWCVCVCVYIAIDTCTNKIGWERVG